MTSESNAELPSVDSDKILDSWNKETESNEKPDEVTASATGFSTGDKVKVDDSEHSENGKSGVVTGENETAVIVEFEGGETMSFTPEQLRMDLTI